MAGIPTIEHRNQEATCYVGNLDPLVDEDLLMELFNQVGRVNSVHMPKDKLTSVHNGYGFVEYRDVADADYAIQVLSMVKVYGRPLRVNKSSLDKKAGSSLDVGANLFLGNLDTDVDEKLLFDTFSSFGTIVRQPKVMRDEDTNQSKGYGFVSFDSFEASDLAIDCMHNQYLCNRQISVQYAYKKNSNTEETGQAPGTRMERHGSRAERMLAASNPMKKFMNSANNTLNNIQGQQLLNLNSNTNNAYNTKYNPSMTGPTSTMVHFPTPMPPPPLPPSQTFNNVSVNMGMTLNVMNPTQMPPLPPGFPPTSTDPPPPPPPPLPPLPETSESSYSVQSQSQVSHTVSTLNATNATMTATVSSSSDTSTMPPPPPPPPPPLPPDVDDVNDGVKSSQVSSDLMSPPPPPPPPPPPLPPPLPQ